MKTEELREMVERFGRQIDGCHVWPNGLGFSRHGYEYSYNESKGIWCAQRRDYIGYGETPQAAYDNRVRRD